MKRGVLFFFLLTAAISAQSPLRDKWFVAGMGFNFSATVMDAVSSHQIIRQGGRETNRLIGSRGERMTPVKAGSFLLQTLAASKLYHEHPRRAVVMQFVSGGIFTAISIHNFNLKGRR